MASAVEIQSLMRSLQATTGNAPNAPGGSTGYRFSHLTGTIFENTNKPLKDWYRVAHLMLVGKKGTALQIFRIAMVEDIKKLGRDCRG